MMKPKPFLYLAAAAVLLSACATTHRPSETPSWPQAERFQEFDADGRLAVKVEGRGSYANFDWHYQKGVQTINVNSPLGNTLGQLCEDRQGVLAVDSKGQVYQAGSAEELSSQLLGFALPVQYLHIWADGRRVADTPYQITSDGRLQQLDWTISRTLNAEGQPRILQLENSRLSLRLVFDEFVHQHDAEAPQLCSARGA